MDEDDVAIVDNEEDESIWEDLEGTDQETVSEALTINSKKRLSCFAHSLQLVVGDGLKEISGTEIGAAILKAHQLSKLLHRSTIFKER